MGNKNKLSVVMKWYKVEKFFYKHHMSIVAKMIYHMIQILLVVQSLILLFLKME